jgi:hydrogenase-1 operon protein HyaF
MLIHSAMPAADGQRRTGLLEAVLREIGGQLERLAADPTYNEAIDLRSLPVTEADRAELKQRLGEGEVRATLLVAGETLVTETIFPGVWWIAHKGEAGAVVAEQIVVARVPEILQAHPDDIALSAARLIAAIEADQERPEASDRQGDRS